MIPVEVITNGKEHASRGIIDAHKIYRIGLLDRHETILRFAILLAAQSQFGVPRSFGKKSV
jgi:hypothetical protein